MNQPSAQARPSSLQIDNDVTRSIRQHARAHMKTEVCGILIGEAEAGAVTVQASIEALNAAQAGTHVTFTQDAWEAIYRIKDETYPLQRIIGWYHSHPGFGVFLSEHDTFIHRNFFSSPDQVAWVYDPHTDEEGCFGWRDGEIHRVPSFSVVDNNGDGLERTPRTNDPAGMETDQAALPPAPSPAADEFPAWMRRAGRISLYLATLLLGFLIAFFFFPQVVAVPVDPATGELLLKQARPLSPGDVKGHGSGLSDSPSQSAPAGGVRHPAPGSSTGTAP